MIDQYTQQILAVLLISLRIAPTFAFAPPFTLLRVPLIIRVLLSVSIAAWLVLNNPAQSYEQEIDATNLPIVFFSELFLGATLALTLQWAHAAILTMGRAIDVQAGFGLALLIDPTSRAQVPLVGTIFAYAAGAAFFSMDGPADLLAIWAESLRQIPLGSAGVDPNIAVLLAYISTVFFLAAGLAGIVLLTLFMIDLTVAFLSRTLPQMNVLLIGFQVKTMALLLTLPLAITYSSSVFIRIVRVSIETMPRMI